MFDFIFAFIILAIPRVGFIDLSLIFGLMFVFYKYISIGVSFDKNFLIISQVVLLLIPISIISYLNYGDFFGFIRIFKLYLLLIIISTTIRQIPKDKCIKYIAISSIFLVTLLYVEYFNIFNGRVIVALMHDFFFTGRDVSYRAKGIFAGYSAAGVSCAFIAIFSLYYTLNNKLNKLIGYSLFLLAFVATFFTARTGVVVSILGIILLLPLYYKYFFSIKVFKILVIFSLVLSSSFIAFNKYADMSNVSITFIRTFEVLLNYQEKGQFKSESTTQLEKTLVLPSSTFDVFFGNGFKPWSIQSIEAGASQTDSGIFQNFLMYGVLGFLLYYFPVIYIYIYSLFFMRSYYLNIVIPLAFLSEIKGHYIYSTFIFVLVLFPFFYNKKAL